MRGSSARAREAVEPDTFARWATSLRRIRRRGPSPAHGHADPPAARPCPRLEARAGRGSAIACDSAARGKLARGPHPPSCNRLRNRSTGPPQRQYRDRGSVLEQTSEHREQPGADRERVRPFPVERAVQLVVPPAVEARGADRGDPLAERDLALAGPDAPGPLVGRRRARRSERVREVDPGDEARDRAGRRSSGVVPRCHRCQKSRTSPTLSRSAASITSTAWASDRRAASRRPARGSSGSRAGPPRSATARTASAVTRRSSAGDSSAGPLYAPPGATGPVSSCTFETRRRRPARSAPRPREHRRVLGRSPALDIGQGAQVHRSEAVERLAQAGRVVALGRGTGGGAPPGGRSRPSRSRGRPGSA